MTIEHGHAAGPRVIAREEVEAFLEGKDEVRSPSVGPREFLDLLVKVYTHIARLG